MMNNNIEILAPAGSKDAFYAAISSGADAVYLGGKSFGARKYADNFSLEEISELVKYAHVRDKKVYVTVNTIILEKEIEEVFNFVRDLYFSDVDALIVQDIGLAKIIKEKFPSISMHASTQMNVHNLNMAKALKEYGFSRIIFPREASLDLIKKIKEEVDIEVEVFVHGALCVSYSGNCYFSSFIGRRSGNRGSCAQPCRMKYTLEKNDEVIGSNYYLSTKDLCTIEYLDALKSANVDCIKIEGRMKRPEYVSLVTKAYKKAMNSKIDLKETIKELKIMFNRGFTKGFLFKENNNEIANITSSNHIGVLIGKVISSYQNKVNIKLYDELNFNDSIRLVSSKTDAVTVNQMYVNSKLVKKAFKGDIVTIKTHESGLLEADVYLTTSAKQMNSMADVLDQKIPVKARLEVVEGKVVFFLTDKVNFVQSVAATPPQKAESSSSRVKEQLLKINNTIFCYESLEIVDDVFLPIKEINALRRNAFDMLIDARSIKYKARLNEAIDFRFPFYNEKSLEEDALLKAKVETSGQLEAALEANLVVYVTNKKLYEKYQDNDRVYYYLPRNNQKSEKLKNIVTSDYSLVNNNISSIYLNVCNSFAVRAIEEMGSKVVGISPEISFEDTLDLIRGYKKRYKKNPPLEMMVYGFVELMLMKYCPIRMVNNIKEANCFECLKNEYYLVDRLSYRFRLIRDEECNIRVLNSKKLHLINYIDDIINSGITNLLLCFTVEDKKETKRIIDIYLKEMKERNKGNYNLELTSSTKGHFLEGVE